jgi:hypothetical protein
VLPVVLLRLSCPGCGQRLPREQTVAEVAPAVLIALLRLRLGDDVAAVVPALAPPVLVTATLTDLRARLIPNALTYPATALALAARPLPGGVGVLPSLLGAVLIWLAGACSIAAATSSASATQSSPSSSARRLASGARRPRWWPALSSAGCSGGWSFGTSCLVWTTSFREAAE